MNCKKMIITTTKNKYILFRKQFNCIQRRSTLEHSNLSNKNASSAVISKEMITDWWGGGGGQNCTWIIHMQWGNKKKVSDT